MRAISLGFHDIHEPGVPPGDSARHCPAAYALDRVAFRMHLSAIAVTAAGERVSNVSDPKSWERGVPVFLTFDDGAAGAYACAADELERRGWRGHFFITTNWIGRPGFLTRVQIRELYQRGHVIGSHTVSHPSRMSALVWDRLLREWSDSCAELSDIVGAEIETASVADGYYSPKVGSSAAIAGIRILFNSEPTTAIGVQDGCLVLGRYSIQAQTPAAESAAIAAGHVWPRRRQAALWHAKKLVKALAGEHYLSARARLLSPPPAKSNEGR